MNSHFSDTPLNIAVIGGGIVGAHVAIGLLNRNISVTIYEQSSQVKEIGAGIGFPSNIVACMAALDPRITEHLDKVAGIFYNVNLVNGCSDEDLKLRPENQLFDAEAKPFEYRTAHRAHLLDGLLQLIPQDRIKLGKHLDSIVDKGDDEKLLLQFSDGTAAEADARNYNPAAIPHYSHVSAYRGLVPMEKATAALGRLSGVAASYLGKGASMMVYPIIGKSVVNVAAFVYDEEDWHDSDQLTRVGSKKDVMAAYSHFGPSMREFITALPDELNRWALFDTYDHPLSSFAYGRIVLAGDAAHASTPHHGAGAGMGIEDALVLATLLKQASNVLSADQNLVSTDQALKAAFKAYDSVRRERAQWLVSSSRHQGIAAQWRNPDIGSDIALYAKDISERLNKVFSYDWKRSLIQAADEFNSQILNLQLK
ncbi:salicylate 1-monooxygenase [Trichoderma arundinaceum]|uniref:Salicylate 1-monooxygenase n=1 Tax=Trichoderma arundinaceum TaxID=490622 RepID=A0A395P0W5_TRIAR|nr:salicylate 1-monooxygenase [Trichoderma arundinaceum]